MMFFIFFSWLQVYELAMFGRIRMLEFSFAVVAKPGEYSY